MRVLFTKSSTIGSWLIRKTLSSEFSHCMLECNGLVLQASATGVVINSLMTVLSSDKDVIIEKINVPGTMDDFLTIAKKYEGAPYDYLGLLGFLLTLICKKLHLVIPYAYKNQWQNTGAYFCSELINEIEFNQNGHLVSPVDLYNHLKQLKDQ